MNHFYRTLGTVVLLSIVMFTTTGCDQIREKVSNLINPKTPQQVLESANQKIANQKFKDALAEIESFGKSDGNLEGDFALAAAKSSFQVGENDKGYAYLSKALKANSISSAEAMNDPLFEPVRTDIRFVTLLTQTSTTRPNETEVSAGGDVSIKMNSSGSTEVKAGNVSIKLP